MIKDMEFKAACIQMCSGRNMDKNIEKVLGFAKEAVDKKADIIFMPENVTMIEKGRDNIIAKAMAEKKHTALDAFKCFATKHKIWMHCGTIAIKLDEERIANRTYVLNPKGEVVVSYDKIHLFDVVLSDAEKYVESEYCSSGNLAKIVELPWGKMGLSICYDVRFPHLYRTMAKNGAGFMAVPAAFTVPTGKAHWHILLRARAIENGSYIFAPAQCGEHETGRKTYGHSLIISPWGEVLADAEDEEGVIFADIDTGKVTEARKKIPSLKHDRNFEFISDV